MCAVMLDVNWLSPDPQLELMRANKLILLEDGHAVWTPSTKMSDGRGLISPPTRGKTAVRSVERRVRIEPTKS